MTHETLTFVLLIAVLLMQMMMLLPMGPYPIACDKGGQRDGTKQPFKTIAGKIIGLGETDPIEAKDNHGSSERG